MIFKTKRPRVLEAVARVRRARFPVSDHCDGKRFLNVCGTRSKHRVLALLRWTATRHLQLMKKPVLAQPEQTVAHARPVADGPMRVTWVGHSTLLLELDGVTVLTDPIWSQRCSPLAFAGPKRRQAPGIVFEDLPRVDVVLISHNHYDHLDLPTVRRLAQQHDPLFVVPLGLGKWFKRHKMNRVVDLDWWQTVEQLGLDIHMTPARHYSGRTPWDANRTLWGSYVVEGPSGRFYFGGDTGYGPHFAEIGKRFGPFHLAALPIGAYEPRWFMCPVHMAPEQAVTAHQELNASQSVAIHFGTFKLTDEPWDEPPILLHQAMRAQGLEPDRFWVMTHGETRVVPHAKARHRRAAGGVNR